MPQHKVVNFLGIQIFNALEGAEAGRLSETCSGVLGLNPNRRLTEQENLLPFSLDVVFGSDSFPKQISQVLVQEDKIKETQLKMMAKEDEIMIDVDRIRERANEMYNNQQVMMDTLSDIQEELDIDQKDSKSKKSKKAKGEKTEQSQADGSDLFERRLSGIEEMVTKIEEIVASGVNEVKTEVKESIDEAKTEVKESTDEIVDQMKSRVEKIEHKVDNMEKSIEDIKEMLSQLIMKG